MASTEAICDIPVHEFQPGVDNLDDWFDILENGIKNVYGEDGTEEIRKTWLRLKLDAGTRKILRSCNQKAKWEDLKAELSSMMVTQQDKYNWRAGHNRVQWDGHESFHVLAVRVRQSVDTHMDNPREIDYYDNFRNALPPSYRSAIDLHSKKDTLEEAKDVAFRFQVATSTLAGANQEERSNKYEDRRDRYVDRRDRYDDRYDRYDDRYDRHEHFDSHDNTRQDSRHHYRNPRQDSGYDNRHDSRFDDRYDDGQDRHHERRSYNYEDENRGNRYEECQGRRDNFRNRNDHRDEYDIYDDDCVEQDRDADWFSRSVREERERRSGSRRDD